MKLFKKEKKVKDPLKKILKKYPRKKRANLRKLYNDYQKGKILQPDKDIDNKQLIIERS